METYEKKIERELLAEAGVAIGDRVRFRPSFDVPGDRDLPLLAGVEARVEGVDVEVEDDGNGETGPRVSVSATLVVRLADDVVLYPAVEDVERRRYQGEPTRDLYPDDRIPGYLREIRLTRDRELALSRFTGAAPYPNSRWGNEVRDRQIAAEALDAYDDRETLLAAEAAMREASTADDPEVRRYVRLVRQYQTRYGRAWNRPEERS